jgi:hypothetical protein
MHGKGWVVTHIASGMALVANKDDALRGYPKARALRAMRALSRMRVDWTPVDPREGIGANGLKRVLATLRKHLGRPCR